MIPERSPSIVYGLEYRIPLVPSVPGGVQHVAAMVVDTFTPPPVIGARATILLGLVAGSGLPTQPALTALRFTLAWPAPRATPGDPG